MEMPAAARALLDDPAAGMERLAAQMTAYWERAIEPVWDGVRATLEADIAYRAGRLAAGGPLAAFADLHASVAWRDGVLEVHRPHEAAVELGGRGLLLVPAVFAWPELWTLIDPPWQPAVIYAPRGVAELWAPEEPGPGALADLLGRRRARILAALESPASTQELARRLAASPAGVSEHLGVLRRAGLVAGRRDGRTVRYARTRAGDALVRAAG
jgi:DNA-binding transcriptional ArsR family regulator